MSRLPIALGALLALFAAGATGCVVYEDEPEYVARPGPPPQPPLLAVYEPCFDSYDCAAPADACYEVTVDHGSHVVTDGTCSLQCIDDLDCPYGGACYSVQGQAFICYQRCLYDSDCPLGFACIDTVGGAADAICLPY